MRRVLLAFAITAVAVIVLPALPLDAANPPPEVVDETIEGLPAERALRSADAADDVFSAPVETPIPFTMVGFSVPDGAELEYRTSDDGDEWTPWNDVDLLVEDGDGPEQGGVEDDESWYDKTEPEWVGEARWVQVRGADPEEVEVHLIDSDGLTQTLGERVSRAAQGVVAAVTTSSPAQASSGQPSIVTRAQWGANESWRGSPRYASNVRYAVVHHTAGSNTYSRAQAPAVVRGIYSYHARTLGWADIGYNFLVDRYGTVYEGRAGGMERGVIGAHAAGFNTGSVGISIMGNFQSVAPPQVAQQAVADVLSWKFDLHGIVPEGQITVRSGGSPKYSSGTEVRIPKIIGHRDVGLTSCPGNVYYQRLGWLRAEVRDTVYERQSDPVAPISACSSDVFLRLGRDHSSSDMTSWAAGQWYFQGVNEVVVASSADYADALAGSVLAADRGAPMMLTAKDQLSSGVKKWLDEQDISRVWLLGGQAAISGGVASAIEQAAPGAQVTRLAGSDRFETAGVVAGEVGSATGEVAIALGRHADSDSGWPDALSAASLAATPDRIPTLLTRERRVPDETLDTLDALGVSKVHVLGGTAAIAKPVVDELRGRGLDVARLAGSDRYATSVDVAAEASKRFSGTGQQVTFASGRSFRDALIAGPVAAKRGGPLLLVPPDDLSQSTELVEHLRSASYGRGILVGSDANVAERVGVQLCEELR